MEKQYNMSAEHRAKISLANKGKYIGEHHSPETEWKKGQTAWNKGLTKETDASMLSTSKSLTGKNNYMFGKHQSKEWILKRSSKHIGMKRSPETKLKMSLAAIGRPKSEEHKAKYREARKNWVCPKFDTSIEIKIKEYLEQLKVEFFSHKYMNIEHSYQCDIFIPSLNLVIECDGNYWHKYPTGTDMDHIRTKELIDKGFKVLRLWESEIKAMDVNKFQQLIK